MVTKPEQDKDKIARRLMEGFIVYSASNDNPEMLERFRKGNPFTEKLPDPLATLNHANIPESFNVVGEAFGFKPQDFKTVEAMVNSIIFAKKDIDTAKSKELPDAGLSSRLYDFSKANTNLVENAQYDHNHFVKNINKFEDLLKKANKNEIVISPKRLVDLSLHTIDIIKKNGTATPGIDIDTIYIGKNEANRKLAQSFTKEFPNINSCIGAKTEISFLKKITTPFNSSRIKCAINNVKSPDNPDSMKGFFK